MLNNWIGFTLWELLITLIIISILILMGKSGYENILLKTRRLDAKTRLLNYHQNMQSCIIKTEEYENCMSETPSSSLKGFYKITWLSDSPYAYLLIATPEKIQEYDKLCYQFLINEQNQLYAYTKSGEENRHCW